MTLPANLTFFGDRRWRKKYDRNQRRSIPACQSEDDKPTNIVIETLNEHKFPASHDHDK